MRFGVVVFPASNCDMDTYHVIDQALGHPVAYIWHQERSLDGFDCVILPEAGSRDMKGPEAMQ